MAPSYVCEIAPTIDVKLVRLVYTGSSTTGYGSALPTDKMIRLPGCHIWRRVYATCWGNSASIWVKIKGDKIYFRDCDFMSCNPIAGEIVSLAL